MNTSTLHSTLHATRCTTTEVRARYVIIVEVPGIEPGSVQDLSVLLRA